MMGATYPTKKALKAAVGERLQHVETSMFGNEYEPNGRFPVVGPCPYTARRWFAEVTMKEGRIAKVT